MFYTEDEIHWLNPEGEYPDWSEPQERWLGCHILGGTEPDLLLLFNASTEAVWFVLPSPPDGQRWRLAADTSLPSPQDLLAPGEELSLDGQARYRVGPRSSVILVMRP
jgi:glycogen operon protein